MSYKTGFYEGRLGIGLDSTMGMGDGNPRYPLDINGDIRLTGSIVNGDGQVLSLTPAAVNWTIDDDDIFFTAGGNVGIGTTSPDEKLHIKGGNLIIERPNTEVPRIELIRNNSSKNFGGDNYQDWAIQNSGGNFQLISGHQSNGNTTVLTSDGTNVGIGTTSPYTKFEASSGTYSESGENSPQAYNTTAYWNVSAAFTRTNTGNNNHFGLFIGNLANSGASYLQNLSTNYNNYYDILLQPNGGNVGIGTTSPGQKLSVNGVINIVSGDGDKLHWTHVSTGSKVSHSAGWCVNYDAGNSGDAVSRGHHIFRTSNSSAWVERMRITDAGNVGIGTTTPHTKLDFGDAGGDIRISQISGLAATGTITRYIGKYYTANTTSSPWWCAIKFGGETTNGEDYISFITQQSGTPHDERMRITGTGNVGIGTSTPGAKLEIRHDGGGDRTSWTGDILRIKNYAGTNNDRWLSLGTDGTCGWIQSVYNSTNSAWLSLNPLGGNVGIGTTNPQGQLSLYKSGDNGGELWFGNSDINGATSKNYGKISFNTYLGGGVPYRPIGHIRCVPYGSNYGGDIIFNTQNDIYGGGDRMVIRGNGNVGIGRTDPTYKLDMYNNGSARLARFQTTGDVSIEISSTSPSSDYDDCGIVWHGHNSAPWWHLGVTDNESRLCIGYQSNSSSTGWPDSSEKIYFASDGKVLAAGFTNYSDDRIKNNEKTVTNALDIINKLQTKKYFKSTKMYSKEHNYILNDDGIPIKDESGNDITNEDYNIETGFIAQDVKKIPELAYSVFGEEMKYGKEYEIIYDESGNTIDDGTGRPKSKKVLGNYPKKLGVTYQDIFCYNVSATQELDRKVIALENENAELKAELAAIKQHLGI